ncbi:hypothetical protein SAMN06265795_12648 [Noviherbaspirillum humi]|uniref:Uncharacterized protein n=1 Tax=Noviherbaspirillum humi TaxID=1688639 RepID=A0A239LTK0_9BURK|nr:hypothetical protein [Noviherbaspirillum humi]SNT33771.1 hypothetical protein SAMN06265795_12648 [Noviherbaspirillum humi]
MAIDTSMYGSIQPLKMENPLNALTQAMQVRGLQDQNALVQYKLSQAQRNDAVEEKARNVLARNGGDLNSAINSLMSEGLAEKALALKKLQLEQSEKESTIAKNKSAAGKTDMEMTAAAFKLHQQQVNNVATPQDAEAWTAAAYADPAIRPFMERFGPLDQAIARIRQNLTTPEALQKWKMGTSLSAEDLMKYTEPDANAKLQSSTSIRNTDATNATSRANNAATNATTMRGQNLTDARAREQVAAGKTQYDSERGGVVNFATGEFRPVTQGGAPLPSKDAGQKRDDAKSVLNLLDIADPLIDKSTQGMIGSVVDQAARSVGKSLPGDQAAAQLKALEGMLISKMPKMSGPQSDKDVLLYRQMAGQIGDVNTPAATKKAAIQTIRQINQKYLQDNGGAPAASGNIKFLGFE